MIQFVVFALHFALFPQGVVFCGVHVHTPAVVVRDFCQAITSDCRQRTDPVPIETGRGNLFF